MKKVYLLIVLALTALTAVAAYGVNETADFTRNLATKPVQIPKASDYAMTIYSTASGKQVRRVRVDELPIAFKQMTSALKANTPTVAGLNTTAEEGQRYLYPYNGSTAFSGTPTIGMMQTTASGPKWFDGEAWAAIGVAYDDTSLWAKFADYMLASDHNAYVAATQVKFDNLSTQMSQLKAAVVAVGGTLVGAAPANLSALDFGTINVSTTKTLTAQIDNTGLGNLVMGTATKSGTDAAKYTLNGGCSGQTVAPGDYCVESVTFAPGTVAGTYTAQISFPHNAQGSPTLMNVTGTAQAVQTCSTTPYKDISNITSPLSSPVGSSIYNIYNGIRIESGQAAHTICKIGARIGSVVEGGVTLTSGSPVGALSGINYRAEIWTTDGTGNLLDMKQASANVAAGSMVVGSDAVFQFAANVSLTATDAAIITRADHGYSTSNYINLVSGGTNTDGTYSHSVRYRDTLAVASEVTANEKQFQLYEVQQ